MVKFWLDKKGVLLVSNYDIILLKNPLKTGSFWRK